MIKPDFRILIADDDEIARDVIATTLAREGYAVVTVQDGLEAISRLRTQDIQMVITDLMMPGADGLEVLKYAVRTDQDIAVVILTAYGTLDTTLEAIRAGAYDYLTKPFKTREISILAERAYQRSLLIRENRELKKNLRDTYRDMDILKTVAGSGNPDVTTGWLERIEKLKTMNVLLTDEAEVLKERLVKGNG
ncbi:MAG: response regulator [Nitrospirae bacterium]|nr:response regulator [Nitrospirota bacterium]NTW65162.1 response regulator [Nitrospirota bacterium]